MGYHGKPDWGLQVKKTVYTFDDLSELAVRLGSESFFDRRGDVFLVDNFENGLGKCTTLSPGTGSDVLLVSDRTRSGGYSVKLIGGSVNGDYAGIRYRTPYPVFSKWGFETHFSFPRLFNKIEFKVQYFTGTRGYEAIIRYDNLNSRLQYEKNLVDWPNIKTDYSLTGYSYLFNVFKLVLDLENNKYHRLIMNEVTYDLSAYNMYDWSNDTDPQVLYEINFYSNTDENDYCYIDNVIITQNEP